MSTLARRLAFTVISLAAAGICDWSLFVVANEIYSVPAALAVVVSAVFDGAAVYCLNLASQATREGRSAAGPRIATLALAAVSVYLNVVHATHIHGGLPAALLFAAPTVALLIVSDLSWAALRAKTRADRGEKPMTLPVFGAWGWLLARDKAWEATKAKAESHVTGQTSPKEASAEPEPQPERPVKSRRASDVLRERFAEMDPAEAIRITHEAHPELTPAELASLLIGYGVIVDAVQVVLVLGRAAPRVTVERVPTQAPSPEHLDRPEAPQQLPPSRPEKPVGTVVDDLPELLCGVGHSPIVYFIRNGNRVKIGTSQNLLRRVQTLCLREEDVLLALHGNQRLERDLHERFSAQRVGKTEWFRLRGDLVRYIVEKSGRAPRVVDRPKKRVEQEAALAAESDEPDSMMREDHQDDAPMVTGASGADEPPMTKTALILSAASKLPSDATPEEINRVLLSEHGTAVDNAYIRTVLSREAKKPKSRDSMEGGYA